MNHYFDESFEDHFSTYDVTGRGYSPWPSWGYGTEWWTDSPDHSIHPCYDVAGECVYDDHDFTIKRPTSINVYFKDG